LPPIAPSGAAAAAYFRDGRLLFALETEVSATGLRQTQPGSDIAEALERVEALGGSVVHPGEAWAICKDSEGSPFGLAGESLGA
jgi:hypothetical protein